MSDERNIKADAEVQAAYRAANAARDGSASAEARAAVLAAAARAVQARPHPLGTQATVNTSGWMRFRQPLAVAASVVFGIGIGLSLFRGEDISVQSPAGKQVAVVQPGEMPELKAELETMAKTDPHKPLDAPAATNTNSNAIRQAAKAPVSAAAAHNPTATKSSSKVTAAEQVASASIAPRSEQSNEQDSDAKLVAPNDQSGHAKGAISPGSERLAMADTVKAPAAPASMNLNLAARARSADVLPTTLRNVQDWLAHIILLRKNGQAEQADRELEALHEAYPKLTIPIEALPK